MTTRQWILIIYGAYLVLLSFITFVAYFADKQQATKGGSRVPEKVLLLMSFFGGAYGGFASMQLFRHKTAGEHWYFTAVNLLGIAVHSALLVCIAFVF